MPNYLVLYYNFEVKVGADNEEHAKTRAPAMFSLKYGKDFPNTFDTDDFIVEEETE